MEKPYLADIWEDELDGANTIVTEIDGLPDGNVMQRTYNAETLVCVLEEYLSPVPGDEDGLVAVNGPDGAPSLRGYDYKTGALVNEEWFVPGGLLFFREYEIDPEAGHYLRYEGYAPEGKPEEPCNGPDGAPAERVFYPGGALRQESTFTPTGVMVNREFHENGQLAELSYFRESIVNGGIHDMAVMRFDAKGALVMAGRVNARGELETWEGNDPKLKELQAQQIFGGKRAQRRNPGPTP